ncbi:MAG: hypothetical protein H6Q68_4073 [Firmicutes bacterium]|nr:hypothetical protein [Bacillota bacterium]
MRYESELPNITSPQETKIAVSLDSPKLNSNIVNPQLNTHYNWAGVASFTHKIDFFSRKFNLLFIYNIL